MRLFLSNNDSGSSATFEVAVMLCPAFSLVQLIYFMTSRPLKASHLKTAVKKKVQAERYTLRHADVCRAASPNANTLIETRI